MKEQDAPPQDVGEHERGADAQHEREAEETHGGEADANHEGEADEDVELAAAGCGELNSAEASEADLAENSKVLKVVFLPLLGLLGRITASSPKVIFTVDAWPAAPTLSARAANMLRVGMGAGVGEVGIFLMEREESVRGPGVRLWNPPVPGHC